MMAPLVLLMLGLPYNDYTILLLSNTLAVRSDSLQLSVVSPEATEHHIQLMTLPYCCSSHLGTG
jgi:hypothetical protein